MMFRTVTVAASLAVASTGRCPAATLEFEMRHLLAGQPLQLDSLRYEKTGEETYLRPVKFHGHGAVTF